MLAVKAVCVCAFAALAGAAVASDKWGTETIFLLKGGYGISTNLLSGTPKTKRSHGDHVAAAAPADDAAVGEDMLAVTRTAATLTQQLQAAVHQSVVADDGRRAELKENAELKAELAVERQKVQAASQAEQENARLRTQVVRLSSDLQGVKATNQKLEAELEAYVAKDKAAKAPASTRKVAAELPVIRPAGATVAAAPVNKPTKLLSRPAPAPQKQAKKEAVEEAAEREVEDEDAASMDADTADDDHGSVDSDDSAVDAQDDDKGSDANNATDTAAADDDVDSDSDSDA